MDSSPLFRKVALERMSSPEQLDQLLRVTTPRAWFALIGLIALVSVTILWGFLGQVTSKVGGQGVLIRSGGVQSVVPTGAGRVLEVQVRVGQHVTRGQVIATLAQPSLEERLRLAKAKLGDAHTQKDELVRVRSSRSRLQLEFLKKQRANLEADIQDLQEEAKLVEEQIPVDEELLAKGLVTKQQTYTTRQKLGSIQGDIASRRAQLSQIAAQEFQTANESVESNLQGENTVTDLTREIEVLEKELATQSRVVTPHAGQVLEIKVSPGSLVQAGTPLISLQPDVVKLEAILYVPARSAKEVRPGMDAEISPTEIRREEFGFVRGKVTFVADYPATEEALMRIFENAPLVHELAAGGTVTEVQVELERDPATPSGYRWSSAHGAPGLLSGGTLCLGDIVTHKQRPVSLVFPFVSQTIGLR
jgi:HlyD family secretion protein